MSFFRLCKVTVFGLIEQEVQLFSLFFNHSPRNKSSFHRCVNPSVSQRNIYTGQCNNPTADALSLCKDCQQVYATLPRQSSRQLIHHNIAYAKNSYSSFITFSTRAGEVPGWQRLHWNRSEQDRSGICANVCPHMRGTSRLLPLHALHSGQLSRTTRQAPPIRHYFLNIFAVKTVRDIARVKKNAYLCGAFPS